MELMVNFLLRRNLHLRKQDVEFQVLSGLHCTMKAGSLLGVSKPVAHVISTVSK